MLRICTLAITLYAALTLGAIAASTAFAEETEFLESGGAVVAGALVDIEGELLLADHKGGVFGEEVMMLCSGESLGDTLSSTDGDITAVYALGASDPEGAGKVSCTLQAGICSTPVLTATNLPWLHELMLEGTTPFVLMLSGGSGSPGDSVECSSIAEDTCSGEGGSLAVKNEANGTVDMTFKETIFNCTRGGLESGLMEGLVLVLSVTAGLSIEVMGS